MSSKSFAVAMVACVAASVASAQTNPDGAEGAGQAAAVVAGDDTADYSFGSATQDLVIQASACHPRQETPALVHNTHQFFGNGTAAFSAANCPVTLPHGARVTAMECVLYDASTVGDVSIQLVRSEFDVVTNANLGSFVVATVASTGNAGYQFLTSTLATPETVRRRSGNIRNVYVLFLQLPDTVLNASLRECTILWNRQVSPAPATASFSDVPTNHGQFRFVEALAAAGITGGCGGGNYCPDAPLTRGQMAVFLSTALGLHFPN